ncbi:hypothetical protein K1719_017204 [Acacia pycnantha]|nr:hypothetical protein K1719_017204 [Acacia pycnantha]
MRRLNARTRVNSKSRQMDPNPVKLHLRPSGRSGLFSRNSKSISRSNCFFSIPISIALAFFIFYAIFSGIRSPNSVITKFAIIIDGGSTGTRIHVFKYRLEGGNPVFDFGKDGLASMRVNPGLSSFAREPDGAGQSLVELVDFGKSKIPKESWSDTEIRLMATAGLRILEENVQQRILESCRSLLRSSGFKFRDEWASVITGSDEGVYAWVVANHALGALGGDPLHTTGIIELGGASAQVTFVSTESFPSGFLRAVRLGNTTYNLYSNSFLHFGLNAAQESLREALTSGDFNMATQSLQKGLRIDPCTLKGYSHSDESWKHSPSSMKEENQYLSTLESRGNFSECRSAALMLLQKGKDKCSYQHCDIGSTFVPRLQGHFLATENFFYTSKFFELGPRAFLSELMTAGQEFCEADWSKIKKKYQSLEEEDLLRYCFSSAYSVALLHDSLGVALDDERIKVANQVGSIPLDWALGAFILQSTADSDVQNHNWIANISNGSPRLLSLIAIFVILLFTAWSISKWRKPQLKTIYDLEKGRYIVTRVGRS